MEENSKNRSNDSQRRADDAETRIVTAGFATSHPRQQRQAHRHRQHQPQHQPEKQRPVPENASVLPTDDLLSAVTTFEEHVPLTSAAQKDWDRVQEALRCLAVKLQPPKTLQARATLLLKDPIPSTLRQPFPNRHLYLHKGTYEANNPTEDRSTVVVGQDFLFAGVWDGHGGYQCSEFTQKVVFDNFAEAYGQLAKNSTTEQQQQRLVPTAFIKAYQKTNMDYYHFARTQNEQQAYFAGTCAVGCFVDFSAQDNHLVSGGTSSRDAPKATLYCANLGDSRAVLGIMQKNGTFQTRPLSVDHTAENLLERQRIQALHPYDKQVVMDLSCDVTEEPIGHPPEIEPPDWRVKGVAAFTRSIGDLQLKEKNTSALFNSYLPPANRILPRPGIVGKSSNQPTPPYISTEAEIQQIALSHPSVSPSFVIIACDGVWDEMTSEEAVDVVGDLLSQYPNKKNVNIADLFIERVLEQVVDRLRETDEYEADLTLSELKQRPKGKETDGSRSLLHDDITVIIIQLGSSKAFYRGRRGRSGRGLGSREASLASVKSLQKAMLRQKANRLSHPMRAIEEKIKHHDPERQRIDRQIVDMMDFFDGMNIRHLRILFNALDVDGNGTLDREEVGRLINQVMLTDVSSNIVDLAFEEMDADSSGAVDFLEFVSFFGHHAGITTSNETSHGGGATAMDDRHFSRRASQ